MERMGDILPKVIEDIKEKNPDFIKQVQDYQAYLSTLDPTTSWKNTSKISDKCPYQECDGSGMNYFINIVTSEGKVEMCKCFKEKNMQKELAEVSKIPSEFVQATLKDFDVFAYPSEEEQGIAFVTLEIIKDYIEDFETNKEESTGFYIHSSTKGTGKTMLACCIANELFKRYRTSVLFTTTSELLNNFKATFNKKSDMDYNQVLELYKNVDVLVIDDIGTEKNSNWVASTLLDIIGHRVNFKKVTIYTSNIEVDELDFEYKEDVPNDSRHVTERIVERVIAKSIIIKLPETNVRRGKAKLKQAERFNKTMEKLKKGNQK